MTDANIIVPVERVERTILMIRGQKVMIDADLAKLYGVTTKRLNEQIRRNRDRFPNDFMFQLTAREKNEVVANCDHLSQLKFSTVFPRARPYSSEAALYKIAKRFYDDEQFKIVFDAIRALMVETEKPKRKIGFVVKEPKGRYGKRTRKKYS